MSQGPAQDRDRLVRRSTTLLAGAQAFLWGAIGVFATFGAIVGPELWHREGAAGVLLGVFYLASAAGARVAGRLMDRRGRRPGLIAGHAVLASGGVVAFAATGARSFAGLVAAAAVVGLGAGAALLGRAAVADMYPPEHRGRAVGRLVVAGTIGAVGGPPLGAAVHALAERSEVVDPLALPWLLVTLLAAVALSFVRLVRPDPRSLSAGPIGARESRRSPGTILRLRPALVAVVTIAVGQAVMVTFMSVMPALVSEHGGAPLTVSLVVSTHLAGMFALSPLIGSALDRWGRRAGLLAGMLASGAGLVLGLVSSSPVVAAGALFLIGVGWSAAYLGSTAVVSDLATPSERAGALGLTDLVAALSAASGVLGGAAILELSGFVELTFVALALLALPAALLLPLREATPGTWSSPAREAVQKG